MSSPVYRKMERDVQRFAEDLPIDALLPELEAGSMDPAAGPEGLRRRAEPAAPTAVEMPAAPTAVEMTTAPAPAAEPKPPAEWEPGVPLSERDDEARARRPKRQIATPRRRSIIQDSSDDLESEIRDFMNRDKAASSDEEDFSEFLDQGIDPNVD